MADGPLGGTKVLDLATIYAGPLAAMLLGDFGADVIKIEHPRGDPLRTHGHSKNGHGLWWKIVSRNKFAITLDLSKPEGQELLLRLAAEADVVIENFRPGVLERWNLGYDRLAEANPGLVLLRVTGFGQTGPYSGRPGFGTLAESMSGFAHITGEKNGPPTLPPFGLADGIAGLAGTTAVMFALYNRDVRGGKGQVIDLAIIEPILTLLGDQPIVYDQLGIVQERNGNRSSNNAPRNTYRTKDGRWVAVSSSALAVAERLMRLVGHAEVIDLPWFSSGGMRAQHADELDEMVGSWIGRHNLEQVVARFEEAGAAIAPIYTIADAMGDPQYNALKSITSVMDEDLGPVKMQNVMFRMLETPGGIRFPGRRLGQDNLQIYGQRLGLGQDEIDRLQRLGVI